MASQLQNRALIAQWSYFYTFFANDKRESRAGKHSSISALIAPGCRAQRTAPTAGPVENEWFLAVL
jgi:hypothetical protein